MHTIVQRRRLSEHEQGEEEKNALPYRDDDTDFHSMSLTKDE